MCINCQSSITKFFLFFLKKIIFFYLITFCFPIYGFNLLPTILQFPSFSRDIHSTDTICLISLGIFVFIFLCYKTHTI